MQKFNVALATLAAAVLLIAAAPAHAQQKKEKVTRQQAWSLCAAEVNKLPVDQHSQRYTLGAACMKKYGFRI